MIDLYFSFFFFCILENFINQNDRENKLKGPPQGFCTCSCFCPKGSSLDRHMTHSLISFKTLSNVTFSVRSSLTSLFKFSNPVLVRWGAAAVTKYHKLVLKQQKSIVLEVQDQGVNRAKLSRKL